MLIAHELMEFATVRVVQGKRSGVVKTQSARARIWPDARTLKDYCKDAMLLLMKHGIC